MPLPSSAADLPQGVEPAASPKLAFYGDDFTGAFGQAANPLWAAPAVRNVEQLSDFGLIVLISGSPEDTRAWIEQATSFAPKVPTVALVGLGHVEGVDVRFGL